MFVVYESDSHDDLFQILEMDSTAVPWFIKGMPNRMQQAFKEHKEQNNV